MSEKHVQVLWQCFGVNMFPLEMRHQQTSGSSGTDPGYDTPQPELTGPGQSALLCAQTRATYERTEKLLTYLISTRPNVSSKYTQISFELSIYFFSFFVLNISQLLIYTSDGKTGNKIWWVYPIFVLASYKVEHLFTSQSSSPCSSLTTDSKVLVSYCVLLCSISFTANVAASCLQNCSERRELKSVSIASF